MRSFRIYSPNNFHMSPTAVLVLFIMLYIMSLIF